MKPKFIQAFSAGIVMLAASDATAQVSRTDDLAQQWRASRLADLKAERDRIDAQIAALPTALPNIAPVPPATGGAAPPTAAPPLAVTAKKEASSAVEADGAGSAVDAPSTGGRQTFGGLDLGVGLSFTLDVGKLDRISRASVVNGVVRTDDQDNGRARIMLESHYFFTPCTWNFLGLKNPCETKDGYRVADPKLARWGLGPFIAIQPGSENIIDAIGMGIMVGARREQSGRQLYT